MLQHLKHSIPPVYNSESKVLILGSFPSVKSRESNFFYGHPQNRFWRVIANICDSDLPNTIVDKQQMLLTNHIALWDVIDECDIEGSADSSIKNVKPNNLQPILKASKISHIFVNGKTAQKLYQKYLQNQTKMTAVYLPSTSPANAAWSLSRLQTYWRDALIDVIK